MLHVGPTGQSGWQGTMPTGGKCRPGGKLINDCQEQKEAVGELHAPVI